MAVAVGCRVLNTMRLVEDRDKDRSTDKKQKEEQANGFSQSFQHENFKYENSFIKATLIYFFQIKSDSILEA